MLWIIAEIMIFLDTRKIVGQLMSHKGVQKVLKIMFFFTIFYLRQNLVSIGSQSCITFDFAQVDILHAYIPIVSFSFHNMVKVLLRYFTQPVPMATGGARLRGLVQQVPWPSHCMV